LSIVTSLRALVPFNASEGLFDGRGQRVIISVEDEDGSSMADDYGPPPRPLLGLSSAS
jgi:hypothetical protein